MLGILRRRPFHLEHVIFEVTQRCNHDCPHCYNVWKGERFYPPGELDTPGVLGLLEKVLRETGARLVTLTGGEPLLRPDLYAIVDFLAARRISVNLVSNGRLLDAAAVARLAPGKVSVFELPLLSSERAIHDRMSGSPGAFDRVTAAMAELKLARQTVVGVFVATRENLPTWQATVELAVALGLDGLMFNRFNPGGRGCREVGRLQASPEELRQALAVADEMSGRYRVPIACSIPMPPCLFERRYARLGFGFCEAGTDRAYYAVDPVGNLRPCNHSPTILGNLRGKSFRALATGRSMRRYRSARPAFCAGCRFEAECQGGCKAAAEACTGSSCEMDPFLAAFASEAVKPGR